VTLESGTEIHIDQAGQLHFGDQVQRPHIVDVDQNRSVWITINSEGQYQSDQYNLIAEPQHQMLTSAFAQRKRFAIAAMARKNPQLAPTIASQQSISTLFQKQFEAGASEMGVKNITRPDITPMVPSIPTAPQTGQQKLERYFGADSADLMGD
jgi:hypothetical protein